MGEGIRSVGRQRGTSRDVITTTNETDFCGLSVGGVMRTRDDHVITALQKIWGKQFDCCRSAAAIFDRN